jgi:hypothetical protein
MRKAIEKALTELDDLGDKAIRVRVLGIKGEGEGMESAENEMAEEAMEGEHPKAEAMEQVSAELANEMRDEPEDDLMADPEVAEKVKKNPELLKLLKAALAG